MQLERMTALADDLRHERESMMAKLNGKQSEILSLVKCVEDLTN